MKTIKHYLVIKDSPVKVYEALTTEEGLKSWFATETIAKPQVGFSNVFIFGKYRNEMKVTKVVPNASVEWKCVNSIDEWIGTTLSFDIEEKDGKAILRFAQSGWKEVSDIFARSSYDWAQSLRSLKLLCETGTGSPA